MAQVSLMGKAISLARRLTPDGGPGNPVPKSPGKETAWARRIFARRWRALASPSSSASSRWRGRPRRFP